VTQANLALTWRVLKRFWRTASPGTGVTSCVYILQTQTVGTPGISQNGADRSLPETDVAGAQMRHRLLCAWPRVGPSHRYADPAHLLSRVRTPFACSSLLTLLGALFCPAAAQPGYRPANMWLRRLGSHLSPSNAAHRSLALPKLLGLMHEGFFTSSRSIIYFRKTLLKFRNSTKMGELGMT
jgi:hypothetical protein